jgi:hypothetical protein
MEGRVAPVFPASLVGHIAELLVEVYALASAGGGLTSFKPGSDVDHKDIIVDKRGDYRNAYVQVKCATHLDREGRVVGFADYDEEGVPENPRLVYLFGLLDLEAIELSRIWFVPSADFNRLAYRQHKHDRPGRVILQFSALASGESVWSPFEVTRAELGPRFLELIDSAPPAAHPVPGLVLSRT